MGIWGKSLEKMISFASGTFTLFQPAFAPNTRGFGGQCTPNLPAGRQADKSCNPLTFRDCLFNIPDQLEKPVALATYRRSKLP